MTTLRIEATDYVLDHSWTCRRARKHACRLARCAVEYLETHDTAAYGTSELNDRLTLHLMARVRNEQVGNPLLIWILLNVVVPMVVRLVIEWWLNRKDA